VISPIRPFGELDDLERPRGRGRRPGSAFTGRMWRAVGADGRNHAEPGSRYPVRPPGQHVVAPRSHISVLRHGLEASSRSSAVNAAEVVALERVELAVEQGAAPSFAERRPRFVRAHFASWPSSRALRCHEVFTMAT